MKLSNSKTTKIKIYLVHVIEWTEENEENIDEELAAQIKEGRLILRSIILPRQINDYKDIVKLGHPFEKIVELTDKLKIDTIIMGKNGKENLVHSWPYRTKSTQPYLKTDSFVRIGTKSLCLDEYSVYLKFLIDSTLVFNMMLRIVWRNNFLNR